MDWAAAIRARRLVSFRYHGKPRIVVPAVYGRHATSGNLVLRAYQVGGSGSSRASPYGHLFLVDEIEDPVALEETYPGEPHGYQRDDRHISPIYARLE
ncbi:MAG TPA: hypothetical protein VHC01_15950 [Gaiellaceae bacterium]|nr:hypothetical protein [Gaiellaceae bacterium]